MPRPKGRRPPKTISKLAEAIQNRQNVRLVYDGFVRDCSPHSLGLKDGEYHCLVYQFGGMTSTGPISFDSRDNWRCLLVSKIERLEVIGGGWHSFENAVHPASCVDEIEVEANL